MADIYGSHFEYGDISSRKYGLIIASVESNRMAKTSGDIEGITIFSKASEKRYLVGNDMSNSPLSFEIEIVSDSERTLDFQERRRIEKWLFNRRDYRKLYIDMADDPFCETYEMIDGVRKRCYLNCRLLNPEKLEYNGGIVGYKATLEADSGMLWQDPIQKSFLVKNGDEGLSTIITVDVDTDLDDYIYPKVKITMGSVGGEIIISNNSDDSSRLTKFVGLSAFSTITMKGDLNYVSGQYYEKFSQRNFVRLLDGVNKLTVMGDVDTIEIEFQNRRSL